MISQYLRHLCQKALKKKVKEIVNTVFVGDSRDVLKDYPDKCVDLCVTSPPYWGLRDYGVDNQIGLELERDEYIGELVSVFDDVHRILKDDGTMFLNLGDSYSGSTGRSGGISEINSKARQLKTGSYKDLRPAKVAGVPPQSLMQIPSRVAIALQDSSGWIIRSKIIWSKTNPMPESVDNRPSKSHETIFFLSKIPTGYYYNQEVLSEPAKNQNSGYSWLQRKLHGEPSRHGLDGAAASGAGGFRTGERRNMRTVITLPTNSYKGAHFATFPPKLISPFIKGCSRKGGIVLDPFMGSGTVAEVSKKLGRLYTGVELNKEYHKLINERTSQMEMFI